MANRIFKNIKEIEDEFFPNAKCFCKVPTPNLQGICRNCGKEVKLRYEVKQ